MKPLLSLDDRAAVLGFSSKIEEKSGFFNRYRDFSHIETPSPVEVRPSYAQYIAKSYNSNGSTAYKCSPGVIAQSCGKHVIYKVTVCNREYCTDCGKKNSLAHRRRVSRWWGKLRQIETLGYLVITIPERVRDHFRAGTDLQELRTYVRRKLKREGIDGRPIERGFIRYHYTGDCERCKGNRSKGCMVCDYTGSSKKWHPHLNVLFDSHGFYNIKDIHAFAADVMRWITNRTGIDCRGLGNCKYNYTSNEALKTHRLKYVTRATLRFYDRATASALSGFHTGCTFGKFEKVIPSDAMQAAEYKCCPECLNETGEISPLVKVDTLTRNKFEKVPSRMLAMGLYLSADPRYKPRRLNGGELFRAFIRAAMTAAKASKFASLSPLKHKPKQDDKKDEIQRGCPLPTLPEDSSPGKPTFLQLSFFGTGYPGADFCAS